MFDFLSEEFGGTGDDMGLGGRSADRAALESEAPGEAANAGGATTSTATATSTTSRQQQQQQQQGEPAGQSLTPHNRGGLGRAVNFLFSLEKAGDEVALVGNEAQVVAASRVLPLEGDAFFDEVASTMSQMTMAASTATPAGQQQTGEQEEAEAEAEAEEQERLPRKYVAA